MHTLGNASASTQRRAIKCRLSKIAMCMRFENGSQALSNKRQRIGDAGYPYPIVDLHSHSHVICISTFFLAYFLFFLRKLVLGKVTSFLSILPVRSSCFPTRRGLNMHFVE